MRLMLPWPGRVWWLERLVRHGQVRQGPVKPEQATHWQVKHRRMKLRDSQQLLWVQNRVTRSVENQVMEQWLDQRFYDDGMMLLMKYDTLQVTPDALMEHDENNAACLHEGCGDLRGGKLTN